jgi:mono/diheme cytochrome c family protein
MRALLIALLAFGSLAHSAEEKVPVDPATGMKIAPDWEVVRNHCIVCHSPTTFLRQRATEANWTATLEWMQKHGGLWKLDPAVEKTIVKYLATHYGPGDATNYRRAPIPATLMPLNPYATDARLEAEKRKMEGLIPTAPPVVK